MGVFHCEQFVAIRFALSKTYYLQEANSLYLAPVFPKMVFHRQSQRCDLSESKYATAFDRNPCLLGCSSSFFGLD